MKTVKTNVTDSDLIAAQGGVSTSSFNYRLWVECPEHYETEEIDAEDILYDSQITVIEN